MDENSTLNMDAGRAFEALRAEVSLLRRALEGLSAERQAVPDYAPTLAQMSAHLEAIMTWARRVSERPGIKLTPSGLVQEIENAGHQLRQADRQAMEEVTSRLDGQILRIDEVIRRDRSAGQQRRLVQRVTAGGVAFGIVLWSILPGAIARSLPVSWHMPERLAAGMINTDRWNAGQQMMASVNPKGWQRVVDVVNRSATTDSTETAKR